ncbi:MAG: hypothetical protein ACXAC7_08880 [Candidatus Hodarchaeales archaeon]
MVKKNISYFLISFAYLCLFSFFIALILLLFKILTSIIDFLFKINLAIISVDFFVILFYLILFLIFYNFFGHLALWIDPVPHDRLYGSIVIRNTDNKLCSNCGYDLPNDINLNENCPSCKIEFGEEKPL